MIATAPAAGDPGSSSAANRVLVVGDLMVDVVASHHQRIAVGSDTAARIHLAGGGSAANTAAWLAHGGETPCLLAAVGDDHLGRRALDDLADARVTFVGPVLPGVDTGACVVLVGPDRERTMLPDRGANDRLPVERAAEALEPAPGWVHLSGYTLLGEGSRPAGRAVIAAAMAAGCPVSIDASSAAPLRSVGAEVFLGWIEGIDLVFANDDEIDALGGVEAVLGRVAAVIVKHGADGATWTDGVTSHGADGVPVEAIDTTGAGDAFAAGWIAARRRGDDEAAALSAAVEVGAEAVVLDGARPPRPT